MKTITRKALEDALERLIEGSPNNRELKKKAQSGKLKINNSTVEKEANLSVGVLRNHPDIKELIKKKLLKLRVENSNLAESETELLQEENKRLKREKTQVNRKKKEYLELSRCHEKALAIQAANHIKMVQELMEVLPENEREKAMDKIVNIRPDNIIEGDFRR